jgi:pentose-5-phosphate-3-epimerase
VLAVRAAHRRGIRLELEAGAAISRTGTSIEKRGTPAIVVLAQEAAVDELEEVLEQVGRPRRSRP